MTKYFVQWDYRSSLGGPWKRGDQVELPEALAEAINRDSPGVLGRQEPAPQRNRMVKHSQNRQVKNG